MLVVTLGPKGGCWNHSYVDTGRNPLSWAGCCQEEWIQARASKMAHCETTRNLMRVLHAKDHEVPKEDPRPGRRAMTHEADGTTAMIGLRELPLMQESTNELKGSRNARKPHLAEAPRASPTCADSPQEDLQGK